MSKNLKTVTAYKVLACRCPHCCKLIPLGVQEIDDIILRNVSTDMECTECGQQFIAVPYEQEEQ